LYRYLRVHPTPTPPRCSGSITSPKLRPPPPPSVCHRQAAAADGRGPALPFHPSPSSSSRSLRHSPPSAIFLSWPYHKRHWALLAVRRPSLSLSPDTESLPRRLPSPNTRAEASPGRKKRKPSNRRRPRPYGAPTTIRRAIADSSCASARARPLLARRPDGQGSDLTDSQHPAPSSTTTLRQAPVASKT
jgi:hypothetical protein